MIHNHPILSLLVVMLAMPFLVSCTTAPPPDTTAEDSQAIRAASKQWDDAFNRGDFAALAALYTEEAKLLPPNSQMIIGREGIEGFFSGGGNGQLTMIDLHLNGDMAYVVGEWTFTMQPEEGEAISNNGKYVEIWKRENDTWMLDVDIWNTSLPLPVPEEEMTEEE